MHLISWNVNGIRAVLKSGHFESMIQLHQPDVLCLQESKARPEQVALAEPLSSYHATWNPAQKAGYSGTTVFSRKPPLSTQLGIGRGEHDAEGRVVTAEFRDFFLVNVYTPNSQRALVRLPYRQDWDLAFFEYLKELESQKPLAICGDLNVAHTEIDLANPKSNRKNAGFSDEERANFSRLVEAGFVDTFRIFTPDPGHYTWWTYRNGARKRNIGWRLDYWLVSPALSKKVKSSEILTEVLGSDHCPVSLRFKRGFL